MNAHRTAVLTALSLVAFASNSILCRLALAGHEIDAASFTAVRLASGALVLGVLAARSLRGRRWPGSAGSTLALLLYAAPFSFAYLRLGAGVGALILFGCVQATMVGWGVVRGERASGAVWLGLLIAVAGLIGLTTPGRSAPDGLGAAAMAIAGVAWGIYSLRGRTSSAPPLTTTAANFLRSLPVAAALATLAAASGGLHASSRGLVLAVASGALASGLGYSLWYSALRGLSATRAAIVQLLVPILAAGGGIAVLGEPISGRVAVAGAVILGGVAIAVRSSA
jgi:drug/metabolite transporter (DMT)-like permease